MRLINSRGFTLVELLAVIIILAIIALIAVPLILNVIEEAKKNAFKDSAYGISKTAENFYFKSLLNSQPEGIEFKYTGGDEESSVPGYKLEYNGQRPQSGIVKISKEGKVSLALFDGTYCAEKIEDSSIIEVNPKDESECILDESETTLLYTDNSGAAYPELSDGMIPITWSGSTWIKADLTQEWYNYENQEWANVVLVNDATRMNYRSANPGVEINEEDVLAYLVWIPRYKYELFNISTESVIEQEIIIEFQSVSDPRLNGTTLNSELTHPAFKFGGEELNGFWVGKFETGTDENSDCYVDPSVVNCNDLSMNPLIKPNLRSLVFQTASTQFEVSRKMNNPEYGMTVSNDAHMMKNIEWGAVAYLSHSKYGKYGNSIYNDTEGLEKEIWINPSVDLLTGCAGDSVDSPPGEVCNEYHTENGVKASTTGNVYGIYDMAGGAWERVMGAMYNSDNSTINLGSSDFTGTLITNIMENYLDKYDYTTLFNDFTKRILGDATSETLGWNSDYDGFVTTMGPWFTRGGSIMDQYTAGPFSSSMSVGSAAINNSFRIVLFGK